MRYQVNNNGQLIKSSRGYLGSLRGLGVLPAIVMYPAVFAGTVVIASLVSDLVRSWLGAKQLTEEDMVNVIADYANWNMCKRYGGNDLQCAMNKRYYITNDSVRDLMRWYHNFILDPVNKDIKEYVPYNQTTKAERPILEIMSEKTAYPREKLEMILDSMYYAAFGSPEKLPMVAIIPRTYLINNAEKYKENPQFKEWLKQYNIEKAERDRTIFDDIADFLNTAKWIILGTGAVVGGVWVYNSMND